LTVNETSHLAFRTNILIFFSQETSAGGLSTLIYYLAMYPEIQAKARAEVLAALGHTVDPTVANLQGLPYTNACIREALRINTPISYIVPRVSNEVCTLGKYVIPANTSLVLNIYAVHHNAGVYPDPHMFLPERFLENGSALSKDSWIAFANGPRQCPARNFALYEQRALTCMLLREYKWELPEKSKHRDGLKNAFSPFALTVPEDLDITFTKIQV
jgi:cytochrome P450